jgi:hypothetical protein
MEEEDEGDLIYPKAKMIEDLLIYGMTVQVITVDAAMGKFNIVRVPPEDFILKMKDKEQ